MDNDITAAWYKTTATKCCVCGRALKDAESVTLGIGPDCRKNYAKGLDTLHPAIREQANEIMRALAVARVAALKGVVLCVTGTVEAAKVRQFVVSKVQALSAMGLTVLAQRVGETWADAVIAPSSTGARMYLRGGWYMGSVTFRKFILDGVEFKTHTTHVKGVKVRFFDFPASAVAAVMRRAAGYHAGTALVLVGSNLTFAGRALQCPT